MDNFNSNPTKTAWKGRVIRLLIYVVVGFLAAYVYRQLKK